MAASQRWISRGKKAGLRKWAILLLMPSLAFSQNYAGLGAQLSDPVASAPPTDSHAVQTVSCPTPPNKVSVTVSVAVGFAAATTLYTYNYTVANGSTSEQDVSDFAVDFVPPVSDVVSPRGWTDASFSSRPTLHWAATVSAPLPPGVPDRGQIPPPLLPIKPGASRSGFSFKSPNGPGPVNYYVQGFVELPVAASEAEAETLAEECPGGFLELAVRGQTQGPVTFLPVEIEVKSGNSPYYGSHFFNPQAPGEMAVAILSTPAVDATSVDPLTVKFGPAGATEIHQAGHPEDGNHDGLLDLVVHFSVPATGIKCGATSATLAAETRGGVKIQGSNSVHTVECKR